MYTGAVWTIRRKSAWKKAAETVSAFGYYKNYYLSAAYETD
jgi:hypothetical protein